MATPYQIKKALGITNGLQRKTDQRGYTPEQVKADLKAGKYNFSRLKKNLENTIRFDTLQNDISSMGKTIEDTYKGWQSSDTMQRNIVSIQSVKDRLSAYNEYRMLFGKGNLPKVDISLSPVLEDFDELSTRYANYKNADSYNNEMAKFKELYSMSSDEIKPYVTKDNKAVAYTTVGGENITWQELYESALVDEYKKKADFYDKSAYKKKNVKYTQYTGMDPNGVVTTYVTTDNEAEHIYNYVNGDEDASGKAEIINVSAYGMDDSYANKYVSEDEKKVFNYIWETEGSENAIKYLDTISGTLTARKAQHQKEYWTKEAKESPVASSIASLFINFGSNIIEAPLMVADYLEDGSIDENSALYSGSRFVDTTRSTVGNMIDSETGQFFYRHGMNLADNVTAMAAGGFGKLGTASKLIQTGSQAMGAVVDSTLDAKARGLSDEQALALGGISGAAEAFFESKSFDALMDTKTLKKSIKQYIANDLKTELSGELLTEATNDIADYLISGDLSKIKNESIKDIALRYADVAAGTIFSTGVLSGGGAVVGGYQQHKDNIAMGQTIKANDRTADVFDLANNPDIASAYDVYTKFAKKGITPENVSDAKLGRMYNNAVLDAQEILDPKTSANKNSTDKQRGAAQLILDNYDAYTQSEGRARTGSAHSIDKETFKDFQEKNIEVKDEEGNKKMVSALDLLIEDGLESAEGTESHRIATQLKEKVEGGKKVTAKEIAMLSDATDQAIKAEETENVKAQLIAKGVDESLANIVAREMRGETLTEVEAERLAESGIDVSSLSNITVMPKTSETADTSKKITAKVLTKEDAQKITETTENLGVSPSVTDIISRKAKGEKISLEEADKLISDAEGFQAFSEVMGEDLSNFIKSMSRDDAKLFLSLYDGKTDIDAFSNAVSLVSSYAKNNFTLDHILKNKSVLSGEQASAIYTKTRIKADNKKEMSIAKLIKKTADKKPYKGFIDDSIIDYSNTSAKGKVNWNDLNERQRKAVTFVKGIAQASGMNLVLVANNKDFNGAFNVDKNIIYLDVYAGIDHLTKLADTIIPTMSHELTHWIRHKAPELWRQMNDIVFPTLQKADGLSESERISKEIRDMLAEEYNGYDSIPADVLKEALTDSKRIEVAREEIIARACEDMLKMSKVGQEMFNSLNEAEQKTLVQKIKDIIKGLLDWVKGFLSEYDSTSYEASIMRRYEDKLNELSKLWDKALARSVEVNQALEKSGAFGIRDFKNLSKAVDTDGNTLFQYKAMVKDEDTYRAMLLKHKDTIGITDNQITELFNTIDKAIDIISDNLEALDYAWEADIDERAFSPVKPNSDSLYKVSLDFSTLCRKRLLQQTIARTLQNALDKNLSTEESIAIRDELMKVQEEGRKIEIACALCYVESARMKSPKQINKFLNNREAHIREFFANKSDGNIQEKIANAEMKARKELAKKYPNGLPGKNNTVLDALTAPKSHMIKADADYIRNEGKKVKASYKLTEHEQAELDAALKMGVDDFTSAKGLENLAKNHPDIFDAYTSFVRNATHSKGIENDTWWRAGDSESIGDALIANMNAENGLRSQSWSDFQVIHLLDYIAATIELSTKGAKRQSYTKVPDYVKLLGNTGDMINMSLIPARAFNGKLEYDSVEGMAYEIAKQLRDEYHETVGTICIGINNEQIKMLLDDITIDMVIPYHHSSMSKAVRKLMHIPAWESYQNYQGEKKLSETEAKTNAKKYGVKLNTDANYQKAPKFSEWFNLEEARQIAKMENDNPSNMEAYKKYGKMYGGYMAMQNAANKYLKLCAERGLAPKFSNEKADFTQDANYWKLLTDRKMVDNVTGEIIEQKAIKPIFNEKSVLEILNDELARYPEVKADQEYAHRKVVEKFLSGDMKVDKSTMEAIKKPIDNVTKVNILESAKDDYVLKSSRNSKQYDEHSIQTALWEAFDHNDNGNDNLIKVSKMPNYFVELLGIDGDFYIYRDHAYENMVSKEQAELDGRPTRRKGKDINFHNLGIETMTEAMLSIENPSIAIAEEMSVGNPAILMILPVFDENGVPLCGVVSFYSDRKVNGSFSTKPHILLTIHKREYIVKELKGRQGLVDLVNQAIEEGRIVDFDRKKIRDDLSVIAQRTRLGNITEKSLNDNLSQFRKKVNQFREKNGILYSKRNTISAYDTMGETERIRKENEKLDADAKKLKEIIGTEEIANRRFLGLANYLKKTSGSSMDTAVLAKMLKEAYSSMQTSESLTWENVASLTHRIAESVMTNDMGVSTEYFTKVMTEIRKDKISLNEEQRTIVEERFGNYGNFHKSVFGRANVTKDGTPLAEAWKTWSKKYPSLFDANLSGREQVDSLIELVDALKQTSAIMEEYEYEEAIRHLSTEIYNQFWNIATDTSSIEDAESYRTEHKTMMSELRKEYGQRQKSLASHPIGETALKYEALLKKVKDSKKKEIALAKKHGREMMDKYKENANKKTLIQRVTANSLSLNEMLVKNSKDKHIPEVLKGPVIKLLNAIDFSSKRMLEKGMPTAKDISFKDAFSAVKDMLNDASNNVEGLEDLYGHDLAEQIKMLSKAAENLVGDNNYVINAMSVKELQALDKLVRYIKSTVNKFNQFHTVNHAKGVANLSQESIAYLDGIVQAKLHDGLRGFAESSLMWSNALPYYVFKRYGPGGVKVFEAMMDGWDKFAFNTKQILDYTEDAYTSEEVKKWSKESKKFEILVPATEEQKAMEGYEPEKQKIELTIPQIMSIYCLSKREQGKKHLYQGGIRVADFTNDKGAKVSQPDGAIFTEAEIGEIISSLTDRQREVADKLQTFMNEVCADWGNAVSMARFGYKAFGEPNYFPIQSDSNNLSAKDATENQNSLYRLLNMSFSKDTDENANNRIVINDIFDVFAQHTSDMAKYNALALPVLDALKWYNYTEKFDVAEGTFKTKGVKQSIERAFGKDGQSYFNTFLQDINGKQETDRDKISKEMLRRYKIATVGANLRVVMLQPTSFLRAEHVMDARYLARASAYLKVEPITMAKKFKKAIANAEKYCGMALWKSLGYYDTNIQRGLVTQIKHADTWKDKVIEKSMKGAELADKVTWGALWTACEFEIRDKRKDLKVGSEEFYEAIGKRLREVIYATQVVDSTMTRSQLMRSTKMHDQVMTSFGSEPTLSYNILLDSYMDYSMEKRKSGRFESLKKNRRKLFRMAKVYIISSAVTALVETLWDAYRGGDDDEEDNLSMYWDNLINNLSITAKIPYVKDLHSLIDGFDISRTEFAWAEAYFKALEKGKKLIEGKGNDETVESFYKNLLKGISYSSGLPIYSGIRDIWELFD